MTNLAVAQFFEASPDRNVPLDTRDKKEQKGNIEHKENTHMPLFVKDLASLAAIALFVSSFSLIIHAI